MSKRGTDQKSSSVEDSPIYPPLTSRMTVDFAFNNEGDAWLLHDRPLPELLKWIEYDQDLETLILTSVSGRIQPLGEKIPPVTGYRLQKANKVTVLYVKNGLIDDFTIVPLITRATNPYEIN